MQEQLRRLEEKSGQILDDLSKEDIKTDEGSENVGRLLYVLQGIQNAIAAIHQAEGQRIRFEAAKKELAMIDKNTDRYYTSIEQLYREGIERANEDIRKSNSEAKNNNSNEVKTWNYIRAFYSAETGIYFKNCGIINGKNADEAYGAGNRFYPIGNLPDGVQANDFVVPVPFD